MSNKAVMEIEVMRDGERRLDAVAVEQPLEIRVGLEPFTVLMRTPGHDAELAAGLIWTEGVVKSAGHVLDVRHCISVPVERMGSVVIVDLSPDAAFDASRWRRQLFSPGGCGICGKLSIESMRSTCRALGDGPCIKKNILELLPDRMHAAQPAFARTGGLHAAAIFDSEGRLFCLREDIGRHNAVDKVIGWALFEERLPLTDAVLLVSGRAGFEIVQKALMAGIAFVVSVSAPSSMAVELAQSAGMTLVGFLRGNTFNVYSGVTRLTA